MRVKWNNDQRGRLHLRETLIEKYQYLILSNKKYNK